MSRESLICGGLGRLPYASAVPRSNPVLTHAAPPYLHCVKRRRALERRSCRASAFVAAFRRRVALPALAFLNLWALPIGAADSPPFETHKHEIIGQIHQVWTLTISDCAEAASDLLVLSTRGGPPTPEKRITWMPCGSALVPDDPRIIERRIPAETAVVDVARIPGRDGVQLVLASAEGIRIEALENDEADRFIKVPGGLALPARPWELSRIPMIDDWEDLGPPSALVPSAQGAWLIDLESGAARSLPLPVFAAYKTWMPSLPETEWRWLVEQTRWPTLSRGDENGDGRLDLIAMSRWAIWVYHAGPDGLPATPSRKIPLAPFDEEQEREWETTATNYFARDLDGDSRVDLVLSTVGGGLTEGRTSSRVYLNPEPPASTEGSGGGGLDPTRTPDAARVIEGGFSGLSFVDVDGDGRDEILETSLEFGVLQVVRFLLTRTAETRVRILRLDASAEGGTREIFDDDFAFTLDFDNGGATGLVPSLGDWNGDGVLDFYLADGDDAVTFRMGSKRPGKPIFGRTFGQLKIPLSGGQSRVADLDGDGLDEIIAFNTRLPDAPLIVFENLGRFPGTRPTLNETDEAGPPGPKE
jgi:hypothetical protein